MKQISLKCGKRVTDSSQGRDHVGRLEGDHSPQMNVSTKRNRPPPFVQRDNGLPHLSSICFIDDHEISVADLRLRFNAKQLVPEKSRALYEGGLKSFRPQHEDGSTRQ